MVIKFGRIFILTSLLLLALPGAGQLVVTGGQNAAQLANVLTGPGVILSNVSLNCPPNGYGTFTAVSTNLGINEGVMLTSGDILNALGPNNTPAAGTDNYALGDSLLDSITFPNLTFDACVLSFDLVASCDTVEIAYVFASEEYEEYVCAAFNDVFAFFISGPGITGIQNIALIPGTTRPVSINTVNNGQVGVFGTSGPGCILSHSGLHTSNLNGTAIQYDGYTTPLLAKAAVRPCSTYRIMLAVADAGDGVLDSGVFLEAGGIRCTNADVKINTRTSQGFGDNMAIEGCRDGVFELFRTGDLSIPITLTYAIGGNTQNGVDYPTVTNAVFFPAGQDSARIIISPFDDGLDEGIDSLFLIISDTVCGLVFADSAAMFISDPPRADFAYVTACAGDPVRFSDSSFFASGPIEEWAWDFGDGGTATTQNPSHIFNAPGSYQVQLVVRGAGTCYDTIVRQVELLASPQVDFTTLTTCVGDSTYFLDQSLPGFSGGSLSSWLWDFGDSSTATVRNPVHFFPAAGQDTVLLAVSNNLGCRASLALPVRIHPLPAAGFAAAEVCDGEPVSFRDTSSLEFGSLASWQWLFGDSAVSSQQHPEHQFPDYGTWRVRLVVSSQAGCVDSAQGLIRVHPNPVADFRVDTTCVNLSTSFTDLSSVPEGTLESWAWNFGDGTGDSVPSPVHPFSRPGTWPVQLTVVSDAGCRDSLVRDVLVAEKPLLPVVFHDTVCKGTGADLRVRFPADYRCNWYASPNASRPFHSGRRYLTPPVWQRQLFWVEIVSPEGCPSARLAVAAEVWPLPKAEITVSRRELEIPNAIVEFRLNGVSPDIIAYYWDFGDGRTSSLAEPVHEYTAPGLYTVKLTLLDHNGCETQLELPDWISVSEEVRLFIPNAFTPNADGGNDFFSIRTRLITELEITIFDRWGQKIFASRDLNFRWDGTDKQGKEVPEGVYVYVLKARAFNGEWIRRSSTITVIR